MLAMAHNSKPDIAVRNRNYHTATGNHMPYEITVLPATRQRWLSRLTPAEAGTRFSDPGGMQGWVDLVYSLRHGNLQ